jgi:Zn-finger nucleic acid-binding protein
MQCPTDSTTLVMSERSGIEIDYCPQCRGVWLDRGELDKIIERSLTQAPPAAQASPVAQPLGTTPDPRVQDRSYRGYGSSPSAPSPDDYYASRYQHGNGNQQGYGKQPRRRRESWLSELFD